MTPTERAREVFEAITRYADEYGYGDIDPHVFLAQSALESGNWTSRRAVEDNNVFGMKHPSQRPTTSAGAGAGGFATYASPTDSVEDYFMRQRYFNVPGDVSASGYMQATQSGQYPYAEEGADYITAWNRTYLEMMTDQGEYAEDGGSILLDEVTVSPSQASASGMGMLLLVATGLLILKSR